MVPFLLGSTKRNELGRVSGRKRLISVWIPKKGKCRASTRLPASGSLFFAGPKKSNQKKRPPRRSSLGLHSFRDFPTRHPGSVGKRRPSMGGALRVLPVTQACHLFTAEATATATATAADRTTAPRRLLQCDLKPGNAPHVATRHPAVGSNDHPSPKNAVAVAVVAAAVSATSSPRSRASSSTMCGRNAGSLRRSLGRA